MKQLAHIIRMRNPYKAILFNILLAILVCFISYLVYLYRVNKTASEATSGMSGRPNSVSKKTVIIKGTDFIVDVADTPDKRMTGLMNVSSLGQNQGMLFIFNTEDKHAFWMKNTLIPLDIIWLDKDKNVVHISDSAKPCDNAFGSSCIVLIPSKKALYVIELNAGISKSLQLGIGDNVEF